MIDVASRLERELVAAVSSAKDKFPTEFKPTRYAHYSESMETIIRDIEKPDC
jgi:hypothetical protein